MSPHLQEAPATFPAPWAARAFAIVNAAAQAGWINLADFQQALIASIGKREATGECFGDEAVYYDCWIESLTDLIRARGVSRARLDATEEAIRRRIALLMPDHDHDHDHEDAQPRPVHVEPAQ